MRIERSAKVVKVRRSSHKRQVADGLSNADLTTIMVEWRRVAAGYRRGEEIFGLVDPVSSATRLEHLANQLETILENDRLELLDRTILFERA